MDASEDNHDPEAQSYRAEMKRVRREANREAWAALREMAKKDGGFDRLNATKEILVRTEGPVPQVVNNTVGGADGAPVTPVVIYNLPDNGR